MTDAEGGESKSDAEGGESNSGAVRSPARSPRGDVAAGAGAAAGAAASAAASAGATGALVAGAELAAEAAAAAVAGDCCQMKLTMQKSQKEGLRLSGQCVLSVDGTQHTLNLECCVEVVPGDGSCWAHAVLRSVRALDIDLLEARLKIRFVQSAASGSRDWLFVFNSLREWKKFGEESVAIKKTTMFREHVARRLLDPQNAALCSEHLQKGPSEDDLGAGGMAAAEARATELGLAYDLQKPQHRWAIALLIESTQFSAAVMQAILHADFLGLFAVVTLSRKKYLKFDKADILKPPKREFFYVFSPMYQPTVLSGAFIAIAVLHESADPSATLEDPVFDQILTEQAEAEAARTKASGTKRSSRQSKHVDPDAWKKGLKEDEIEDAIQSEKSKLKGVYFKERDAVSHFNQLTIVNGTDDLPVWILDSAGSAANRVTSDASVVVDGARHCPQGSLPSASPTQSDCSMDDLAAAESELEQQSSRDSNPVHFEQARKAAQSALDYDDNQTLLGRLNSASFADRQPAHGPHARRDDGAGGEPGTPEAGAGLGLAAGGCAESVAGIASDPQVGASPRYVARMAADTTLENISKDDLKELVGLVQGCPYDREIYEIMRMNFDTAGIASHTLSRHTVRNRLTGCAASKVLREFRDRAIDTKGGDSAEERQWRILYARKTVGYLVGILIASFISENSSFRQNFLPWLLNTFLPASQAVRPAILLKPLHEAIKLHGLLSCGYAETCLDSAVGASGGATAVLPGGTGHSSLDCLQFRIMKDRCHLCTAKFNPKSDWTCRCGVVCCKSCSGVATNMSKAQKGTTAYACDQCLQDFTASNPGKSLLIPKRTILICCQCRCLLTSDIYCHIAGRCRTCGRGFCEACAALTQLDVKTSSRKWNSITVALFDCIFCVGRPNYEQGRRGILTKLIQSAFGDVPSNPLDLQSDEMNKRSLRGCIKETDQIGDLLPNLHFIGLRDLHAEALPFAMRLVKRQFQIDQPVCIHPFSMLLHSRTSVAGNTTPADGEMLSVICRSHALKAMKDGELLLKEFKLPNGRTRRDGPTRVVFMAPDLLKQGPLVNLVQNAISIFADDPQYETFICALGPPDKEYPVVRSLHDRFLGTGRLVLYRKDATPAEQLKLLLGIDPDAVFSFPGWTWRDGAEILYVLKKHGVVTLNTLGFAGIMHFPEGITATLVGSALAASQVASISAKTPREALARFSGNGACYQPAQSHPFLDSAITNKADARSEYGLPALGFIAVCPFKLDRLEPESIVLFHDFLLRVRDSYILFIVRANSMRGQIEEWLKSKNFDQDMINRFLFRPSFADTRGFYKYFDASDAGIDSLGCYSSQTTAQDVLYRGKPFFAPNDPQGLMQSRVGSEVSIAAGLEQVCVGKTKEGTIDLLVNYALDPVLRNRVDGYLARNMKEKKGLFCIKRAPCGWKAALEFYLAKAKAQQGEIENLDFQIPFEGDAAPVLHVSDEPDDEKTILLHILEGKSKESKVQLSDMLRGIKLEANVRLLELVGSGTLNYVIRCQTSTGQIAALKISRTARPEDRMHNDSLLREAANMMAWHRRTQRSPVQGLVPKPLYLMAGGTSCLGTSIPDTAGLVFSFLFEEFIEGDTLNSLMDEHRKCWQETGVLTEKMRLTMFNPLSHGVFLLGHYGLAIMDLKSDNVIVRKTGPLQGTIVFTDLGLGHTFACSKATPIQSTSPDSHPTLLNRRCTSCALSALEHPPKGRLFAVGRKNPGQLIRRNIRCITRKEVAAFLLRAKTTGLANLAVGITGPVTLVCPETIRSRRKHVGSAQALRLFDRAWAFSADLLAVHKMLLTMLTLKQGEEITCWNVQVEGAGELDDARLRAMLMATLNPGVEVQTPMAFERLLDFFVGGLGPGKRRNASENMLHSMNTLPIFPPEYERELKEKGCIMKAGGLVHRPGHATILCPDVSFAVQPDKGIGIRAEEDIPPDTVVGEYAGVEVENSEIGRPYISFVYPSRFVVVIIGNFPELNLGDDAKVSVDGQLSLARDWKWVDVNHNVGPFLNAPSKDRDEDGRRDTANCILDRKSLWRESGVSKMLVKSGSKLIPKGDFLQHKYDYEAGPGGFFKFT